MRKEEINKLFKSENPKICSICGKPSLPNFYRACCDKHRKEGVKIFMEKVKLAFKYLPKVKLHF